LAWRRNLHGTQGPVPRFREIDAEVQQLPFCPRDEIRVKEPVNDTLQLSLMPYRQALLVSFLGIILRLDSEDVAPIANLYCAKVKEILECLS
jgi:hypothetical protein